MSEMPPDTLNEIGVLKRREIEARILMPVLERLGTEFGRDRVFAIARDVIVEVARAQGRELAALLLQRHALPLRRDVSEPGDPRGRGSALLQPRFLPD
jgi:hypothetical protein